MSAVGAKKKFEVANLTSAFGGRADAEGRAGLPVLTHLRHVRSVDLGQRDCCWQQVLSLREIARALFPKRGGEASTSGDSVHAQAVPNRCRVRDLHCGVCARMEAGY